MELIRATSLQPTVLAAVPARELLAEGEKKTPQDDKKRNPAQHDRSHDQDDELEEGLEDTFPASDPPSVSSPTTTGRPKKK